MLKSQLKFSLPVSILKEGKSFIAYSPALDLSTAADSFEEARKRFEEAVQIFFEELIKKGTLEEALLELGWQREDKKFTPPIVISHQTEKFSIPGFAQ